MRWIVLLTMLLPCSLIAVSEQPHHSTAYIAAPGSLDLLPSYSHYSTDHFWNRQGKKLPTCSHFERQSYLLYAEYAINCRNSLTVNGGFSTVREELNGKSQGVEDLEIGWKHMLRHGQKAALTAQITAIIPTGDLKSSIRYAKFGLEGLLLYSNTFCLFNRLGWIDLSFGYRWYQGFPSDQLRSSVAINYNLASRIRVIASTQVQYGLFNGQASGNFNNVAFNPNYRLLNGQIECLIRVWKHFSITIGGFKHLWGQNVGTGGGYFCGTWLDF